jgi:superfamily II DNA/RNA helicase
LKTGCDAIIKSKWQSGRTVAATVATIERIDAKINECQAIFITPRKEFALHVKKYFCFSLKMT